MKHFSSRPKTVRRTIGVIQINKLRFYKNSGKTLENDKDIVLEAKHFALDKHKNQKKADGITSVFEHLEGVVNRIKNLGITDKNILCAAWLHDILESTDVNFDQINDRFGREIAITVLSLTKDQSILKKNREMQYVDQLKKATIEAKIIKLCDISANLKDLVIAPISKTQKIKKIKKMMHYLRIIQKDISEHQIMYPKFPEIIDGINTVCFKFKQKPIAI